MPESVRAISRVLASGIAWIPFPSRLRPLVRPLREWLDLVHPTALYVVTAGAVVLTVRLVLWLMRLPLTFAWQLFGWISGHNVERLSLYNTLAHALAAVIAAKIAFEILRRDA